MWLIREVRELSALISYNHEMPPDDERGSKLLLGVGAFGLVLLGLALLLAVVKSPQLLASWVVIVLQILLIVLSVGVVASLLPWAVGKSMHGFADRIAAIEMAHRDLLRRLKRRSPAFLAIALLGGQAGMLLADKSFDGSPMPTLIVSFCLLISFWISNELQGSDRRPLFVLGWVLWFLTLLYLPVAVILFHGWSLKQFADYL